MIAGTFDHQVLELAMSLSGGMRLLAIVVSIFAGTGAALIQDRLTNGWTWPLATALAVALSALAITQFFLGRTGGNADPKVTSSGAGSVAAGGDIDADIDSQVTGDSGPHRTGETSGISATGDGSIAAGKNIRGKIRSRVRRN